MARTNQPHPNSFLAFARELEGYVAHVGLVLPYFMPPSIAEVMAPHSLPSEMEDYRFRRDLVAESETAAAKLRMLEDGVPSALVNAPEMARHIERQVFLRQATLFIRHTMEMSKVAALPAGSFARRATTVEVIVGEHLAFGAGNRATTALSRRKPGLDSPWRAREAGDSASSCHRNSLRFTETRCRTSSPIAGYGDDGRTSAIIGR